MIIVITGSVGVGKTTIAKNLAQKLNAKYVSLSELAKEFKIEDIDILQTFDFDLDKLLEKVEKLIKDSEEDLVLESHFAHFINPELVDVLIVINRDLSQLKEVYNQREYNEQKIKDNLEVESFNLCFYEAEEEGYKPKQILTLENNLNIEELVKKIMKKIIK